MVRAIALILTVLTGFSGLVYQVAWHKFLAVLLGSQAEATAAVLGIFLGGLSLGYSVFGRVTGTLVHRAPPGRERSRVLIAYGLVEAGIGLYALAFPLLFDAVLALSLWLPHGSDLTSFAIDVALTALLIGPPTILMGGTIPLLTQGLSRDLEDTTRFHAFVYAFNTAGAFAGALAAGFYLVPELGLRNTVLAMGCVNGAAGLVFLALARSARAEPEGDDSLGLGASEALPQAIAPRFAVYASAACLAGFAMMTLQTVLNRIGGLALGASHFTFAMVVASFVLSIALGSLAVSLFRTIRPGYLVATQWALVALLLVAYPHIADAPYWAHIVRIGYPGDPDLFYAFYRRIFLWSLAILIVPLGLSGAGLPLIFHHLRQQVADLGATAGRLYAWNTLGSLLGALLGGYLLLFWFDLHHTYRLAVAASAVAAALVTGQVFERQKYWAYGALALVLAALVAGNPWPEQKLAAGLFRNPNARPHSEEGPDRFTEIEWRGKRIDWYDDDPAMSVAVVSGDTGDGRPTVAIVNNGKSDGQIPADNITMGLAALVPAILTDRPERAFVIGYGTGYTVGTLAALDSVEEVVVAEISSGVMEAAPFFEEGNGHAIASAKTRVIRSDAYRSLLRDPRMYDVIVSEPSNPWVAGVEMLFSREFLQAARERLTPDGVYAQWLHLYESDERTVKLVLRTYLEAFDRVAVWWCNRVDVVILGFNGDQEVDLSRLRARFDQPDYAEQFRALKINRFGELLAHELLPVGVLSEVRLPRRVHTILHPVLSHQAARAFFVSKLASLPVTHTRAAADVGARNSLARRFSSTLAADERETLLVELTQEACSWNHDLCLTLLGHWWHRDPNSESLAIVLERLGRSPELAEAIQDDNLDYIAQLFRSEGLGSIGGSYDSAQTVLGLFTRLYSHHVPFEASALHGAWEGCSLDPRCSLELSRIHGFGRSPNEGPTP